MDRILWLHWQLNNRVIITGGENHPILKVKYERKHNQ